jgi:hypothetical protein
MRHSICGRRFHKSVFNKKYRISKRYPVLHIMRGYYNPHFTLCNRQLQNRNIRANQNTKNVPSKPTVAIISPPKNRPTTFARLRIIFNGAAEALESISVSFRFSAYT